jgi:hypothetical protein
MGGKVAQNRRGGRGGFAARERKEVVVADNRRRYTLRVASDLRGYTDMAGGKIFVVDS